MFGFRGLARLAKSAEATDERRRGGRIPCVGLSCIHGPVIDLSLGGLRIRSKRPLPTTPEITRIELRGLNASITAEVRLLRSIPGPKGTTETAFRFVDNAPEFQAAIRSLALASTADSLPR